MPAFLSGEQFASFCEGAVWVLVDAAIKGLALLALAGIASFFMRRKSAAARHLVWTLAMAGLLGLPFVSVFVPKWQLPILPRRAAVAQQEPAAPPLPTPSRAKAERIEPTPVTAVPLDAPVAPATPAEPTQTPQIEDTPAPATPIPWPLLLCVAWIVGVLGTVLPLAVGMLAAGRLARRARPLDEEDWKSLTADSHRSLLLKYRVQLLQSATSTMPMTWGLWRSVVLLPDDAESWPTEKRRAVLLHELAHVKRRDCLTHAVARLAFALHWFNPVAWLALRRLRIERERACDDLVLTAGSRPSDYAGHLVHIARTMRRPTLASAAAITMAKGSHLEGRVLAILDKKRNRRAVTRWAVGLGLALMAAVVTPLSMVALAEKEPDTPKLTLSMRPRYAMNDELFVEISGRPPVGWQVLDIADEGKFEVYLRVDGSDYPMPGFGYPILRSGGTVSTSVTKHIRPASLDLPVGRHRFRVVFRDVHAEKKHDTGTKTRFDEVTSNEVEVEIVEKLPDNFLRPVYEDGWEAILRRTLRDVRLRPQVNNPESGSLDILFAEALPFNIAFEIGIQLEGDAEARNEGNLTRRAGADVGGHNTFVKRPGEGALTGRRWRLVLTPSAEAARRNINIREYYGQTFVTDWMRFKPEDRWDAPPREKMLRTVKVPEWPRIPLEGGGFSSFGCFAVRDWDKLAPLGEWDDIEPQEGKLVVPHDKALKLSIYSNNNTDLSALDALGPNDLQVLALPLENMIPEAALPHIGRLTGLNMLFLGGSKTTNAGLEHLSNLDSLFHLHLQQCPVTDACIEPLKNLDSLRSLVLYETWVTNAGVKKLRATLPNCRIDWTPRDRLVWKGESSSDDGTMTVTRIGARLLEDPKWTFWKDRNWMLTVHVDNHANRPQNLGIEIDLQKNGLVGGSYHTCKVFELEPGFSGKVELPFRAVSNTARNKVKILVARTEEDPREAVLSLHPGTYEALHEGSFVLPFPKASETPTLTLETHRYVRPGKDLWSRLEPGESDWQRPPGEIENPQCRFRLDGKDYETGSTVYPLGPGWTSATFGGLLVGERGEARHDLELSPGKHTLSMVFLDVPAAASDDPEAMTVFPRIATNEAAFEVVDEIPDGYYERVYEEGWDDLLREKLRDVVYSCVGLRSSAHIQLAFDGGLPFALAFDVAMQAEGPERWVKLGKIAVDTSPDGTTIDTDCGYKQPKPAVDIDTLTSRRWRLVFAPSEEAASQNPRIRRFYGREFVTDWMEIKPWSEPGSKSQEEVPTPSVRTDADETTGAPVPRAILDRVEQNFSSIDDLKVVVDHPSYRKAEQRTFVRERYKFVSKRTYYERDADDPPIPRELYRLRYTWAIKGTKEYWSRTMGFAADEDPPEADMVVAFDGEVCRSKEPGRDYTVEEQDIERRLRQYGSSNPMVGRAWGRRIDTRSLPDWLGDDSARLVGEGEVGGHPCSIVEVPYSSDSNPDIHWAQRFFLGRDMNYALVKYESFMNGRFLLSITNTRLAEIAPGCWLPMEGVLKSPGMEVGTSDAPRKPQTFVVVEAAANTDLDDGLFVLPLTPLEQARQESRGEEDTR
jgi:beta-lactamase regulating signal transducer with metallopeptidase domain